MQSGGPSSLKAIIQKKLLLRLTLVAVCTSIVLSVIVYFTNYKDVGVAILDRLSQATQRFSDQADDYLNAADSLDIEGFKRTANAFFKQRPYEMKEGKFVFAGFYDASGNKIIEFADQEAPHIDAIQKYMSEVPHTIAFKQDHWTEAKRYRDSFLVRTATPLTNSRGEKVAHVEGVFAVSPDVRAAIWQRIIRGILIGIAIVVITSMLIYPLILNLLNRLSSLTMNLLDANLESLETLGCAIAKRDSDTDAHNYRVTIYSVRLAEAAGLSSADIKKLIKGVFLHDVGKIGVLDSILLKPGKLDEDEFEIMKTHVRHGVDIVERSEWLKEAIDVVGCHHEKYDGSGYGGHKPGEEGLQGEAIPVNARIFAIADVFDALTSKRPYKEPFSYEKSMGILTEGSGSHFDPDFLRIFSSIARPLYEKLSGHDDDVPRKELAAIVEKYYSRNAASLIQ